MVSSARNWQRNGASAQRVMIVEDQVLIAMDLEDTVTRHGNVVVGLATEMRYAMMLAPMADIAFVDVNLADGASGPEIGRLLASDYGITVIFMTANPEMLADGVDGTLGVISKPVMPAVAEQALAYASARRNGALAIVPSGMMLFAG